MERRRFVGLVVGGTLSGANVLLAEPRQDQEDCTRSHTAWVGQAMERMQTIKAGMTREKLLTVFSTEGGISGRLRRTYVSRDCPFFKVDVEFEAVGEPDGDENAARIFEGNGDRIVEMSRPYLQFSIAD